MQKSFQLKSDETFLKNADLIERLEMLSAFHGNTHISDPYVDNSNTIFIQAGNQTQVFSSLSQTHKLRV